MHAARIVLVAAALLLIALEVGTSLSRGDAVNWLLVVAMVLLIVSMGVSSWEARRGGPPE